ncbi:hypothetical protein Tco_0458445 [Tanacetum coccineum]
MRRVQTFHLMESEGDKIVPELTTRSSKRDTELELDHEGSKKQKTNEASGSLQEQPEEEETELPQEDLQQMMMVVPEEEVYDLVKERFSTTEPADDKEKELWVELKRLFEPDNDDTLWKLQSLLALISTQWIRRINQLNEYAVLDREFDTLYPMEVDMSYSAFDQNNGLEVGSIWRIQGLDKAYWGFLRVVTMLDIF